MGANILSLQQYYSIKFSLNIMWILETKEKPESAWSIRLMLYILYTVIDNGNLAYIAYTVLHKEHNIHEHVYVTSHPVLFKGSSDIL